MSAPTDLNRLLVGASSDIKFEQSWLLFWNLEWDFSAVSYIFHEFFLALMC
ncbi:hypothetical protein Syun_026703 [Stephania yunnanensis]|uniref:Uncharacterized protein n=1 Tax=Stephania yunnanensis TaxID=152371 RepID=A0AAP0HSF7_9MAGN